MSNKKYVYFVEGPCEEKLIDVLKQQPSLLCPGKIKVINVLQEVLSVSQLLQIQTGTVISLVFDTDVFPTKILQDNIDALRKKCSKVEIVYLAQVRNLEEELVRCTDVKKVTDLTRSSGIQKFKHDFCAASDLRNTLKNHQLDIRLLWDTPRPKEYSFATRNSDVIKCKIP